MIPSVQNPLEIPEIIRIVVENLEQETLASYLTVSRSFYFQLMPIVWGTIHTGRFNNSKAYSRNVTLPTLEALNKNKHYIKAIRFQDAYPSELFQLIECENLSSVAVYHPRHYNLCHYDGSWENDVFQSTAILIKNHATSLRDISIDFFTDLMVSPPNDIWNSILNCQNLDSLYLSTLVIPQDQVPSFTIACSKARRLTFRFIIIPQWSDDADADEIVLRSGNNLRTKDVTIIRAMENSAYRGYTPQNQAKVIRQFAGLESLSYQYEDFTCCSPSPGIGVGNFISILTENKWNLNHLSNLDFRQAQMGDDILAELLGMMCQLKSLNVSGTQFGQLSFKALLNNDNHSAFIPDSHTCHQKPGGHCESIEILNIGQCKSVNGQMIQKLLESCPHLKEFYGGVITTDNIVCGNEWVCRDLRVLKLNILMGINNDSNASRVMSEDMVSRIQHVVFGRLATLTKLKILSLAEHGMRAMRALDLKLNMGLSLLAGLRDIRELKFDMGMNKRLGLVETRWMLLNWPKLQRLIGPVTQKVKEIIMSRVDVRIS